MSNNIDFKVFKNLVDHLYDEVIIWDANYKIAYINKACYRHYGMTPEEMIGKTFKELTEKEYWYPSVLPLVYKEKEVASIIQRTRLGAKIKTMAVPISDENGKLEYVAMNVRDIHPNTMEETPGAIDNDDIENTEFISVSKKMDSIITLAEKIAQVDSPILIQGESGTGKTFLAKYIHKKSSRKEKPFIMVNCAAINTNLLESELFGYVKGAFTGASSSGKKGLIQMAHEGTLFLDEVGEIPLELQAKLLQVLQDREFIPVGGNSSIKVDIKIITATNRNLKNMVQSSKFRNDLFYRLNTFEVTIPPLRERKEDIMPLVNYFLNTYNQKYGVEKYFSEETIKIMKNYDWPGNIREISHMVERMLVTADNSILSPQLLPGSFFEIHSSLEENLEEEESLQSMLDEHEKKLIKKFYEIYPSSRKLAKQLKISQSKANRLIKKYIPSQN